MEQLTPENALSVQHKAWLQHPVTQQLIQVFDKQRESIILNMAINAHSRTPEQHKESAVAINTVDKLLHCTKDTVAFLFVLTH